MKVAQHLLRQRIKKSHINKLLDDREKIPLKNTSKVTELLVESDPNFPMENCLGTLPCNEPFSRESSQRNG